MKEIRIVTNKECDKDVLENGGGGDGSKRLMWRDGWWKRRRD